VLLFIQLVITKTNTMTTTLPYCRYTELINKEADYDALSKKLKDARDYADKLLDENTRLHSKLEENAKNEKRCRQETDDMVNTLLKEKRDLMNENTQLNSKIQEFQNKDSIKINLALADEITRLMDINKQLQATIARCKESPTPTPKVELKPGQVQTAEVVDAKMQNMLDYVNKQVGAISGAITQSMRASNALREMIKIADLEIDTLYKKTGHEKPTEMLMEEGNPLHMLFAMLSKASIDDIDN
jgi:hypothetical protein